MGLDAEGTRDLVVDEHTGFLLPKQDNLDWDAMFSDTSSPQFQDAASKYSGLLGKLVLDRRLQTLVRRRVLEEGSEGRTWFDAMEAMVDCYHEGIALARDRENVAKPAEPSQQTTSEDLRTSLIRGLLALIGIVSTTLTCLVLFLRNLN